MPRWMKIAAVILVFAVVGGLIYLRALHQRVVQLAQTQSQEELERREVIAPPISTPTDVSVSTQLFWISAVRSDQLSPVTVKMPLSADPTERAKQLIAELIADPPASARRTLPASANLIDFFILPDGTAVADFSDTFASEMPSGILSEWLAVTSITKTLAANVPQIARLKILIHGQEAETLAGHIDLTGFFDVRTPRTGGAPATSPTPPAKAAPPQKTPIGTKPKS